MEAKDQVQEVQQERLAPKDGDWWYTKDFLAVTGVKRDTLADWIKKGIIKPNKTAGGGKNVYTYEHYLQALGFKK